MSGIDLTKRIYLKTVDSTNSYARRPDIAAGSWITADEQTQGRGRGQNTWEAIGTDRLIFSAKLEVPDGAFSALPLLIGGAVLKACHHLIPEGNENLTLKWPNDIFRQRKKAGGILIEAEKGLRNIVIVGIGLNISGPKISESLPDAGYLVDVGDTHLKEKIISEIISGINRAITISSEAQALRDEIDWIYAHSYLKGKRIKALHGAEKMEGVVTGYSSEGFLRVASGSSEILLSDTASDIQLIGS